MNYSKEVLDCFFSVRHSGVLMREHSQIKRGEIGTRDQGYVCKLHVRYELDEIKEAKFQAYGSVLAISACEYVCRWLENKTFKDAKKLTAIHICEKLNLSACETYVALIIERLCKKTLKD
ncbi:iron-sulfur cluster assembly scaffold protein [Coxiella endosymbiont of Amblyomma americanum]|uniref:iron-sulfur cluster assembly scaffold protein n=1 Tax=Coxiella endosymbiont of Amblyomma americanum TaxID=325775 RepID=UPI00057E132E|nr:iron-sulfur cluster assembly scaffold protein [Coxiella endosymbiont of Amblyomma americanum]AJC50594.1 NifU-like protein [Coxiella endosymbiont of Amblyomma americanum]AUJ59059.1 hypothetical protein B1F76_02560 [Coxiella-like endosymbiont of Amblyomma americanum]